MPTFEQMLDELQDATYATGFYSEKSQLSEDYMELLKREIVRRHEARKAVITEYAYQRARAQIYADGVYDELKKRMENHG
jgi:hypothetical protein